MSPVPADRLPMRLAIGGIGYTLRGDAALALRFANEELNRTFVCPDGGADTELDVEVTADALPAAGGRVVFDTRVAWQLTEEDGTFALALRGGEEAGVLATFDRGLERIRLRCPKPRKRGGDAAINPFCYPVDQLLSVFALAERRGVLVHSAGLERNGKVLLFPGVSGAGKSTLSRLLADSPEYTLLSDDRVILRWWQGAWWAFGTPWPGEAGFSKAHAAPLGGIFFLQQAARHRVESLTPTAAMHALMPVTSIPFFDEAVFAPILDTCRALVDDLPVGELYFHRDAGVAEVIDAQLT